MGNSRSDCPLSSYLENFTVLIFGPFCSTPCCCNHSDLCFTYKQEHFGKDKPDNFQLFQSPHGKDLLFKDSADGFLKIPSKMDFELYLGYEYVTALQNLRESKRKYLERTMWL